jgi:anti-sigma factor RsiW
MKRGPEQDLMRLLHGELPAAEARELRARLESEPALAADYRRLEQAWQGLSLPPAAPVPPGFAGRVMAQARSRSAAAGAFSWSAAPGWVRAVAAAALVTGAALGVGVGRSWPAPQLGTTEDVETAAAATAADEDYSLAGSYWDVVEDAANAADGSAAEATP